MDMENAYLWPQVPSDEIRQIATGLNGSVKKRDRTARPDPVVNMV